MFPAWMGWLTASVLLEYALIWALICAAEHEQEIREIRRARRQRRREKQIQRRAKRGD